MTVILFIEIISGTAYRLPKVVILTGLDVLFRCYWFVRVEGKDLITHIKLLLFQDRSAVYVYVYVYLLKPYKIYRHCGSVDSSGVQEQTNLQLFSQLD